jgi:uncharacterized paraquat-inducible protein A
MENTSVVKPTKGEKSTDLFTEDFCDECGSRVNVNDLYENNEHYICKKCDDELQKEGDERMAQYNADELAREQDCGND